MDLDLKLFISNNKDRFYPRYLSGSTNNDGKLKTHVLKSVTRDNGCVDVYAIPIHANTEQKLYSKAMAEMLCDFYTNGELWFTKNSPILFTYNPSSPEDVAQDTKIIYGLKSFIDIIELINKK
jgi:hypothetical protein